MPMCLVYVQCNTNEKEVVKYKRIYDKKKKKTCGRGSSSCTVMRNVRGLLCGLHCQWVSVPMPMPAPTESFSDSSSLLALPSALGETASSAAATASPCFTETDTTK